MAEIFDMRRVRWPNVILSGLAATVVVTLTMLAFGTDIVKALGGMMVGMDAGASTQYLAGGVVHLMVGIVYAVVFALLFAPVTVWNRAIKGIVFGFVITTMALVFMPLGAQMMSGGSAAASNPCAPVNACAPAKANPCNPCAANPCASNGKTLKMTRPGNPCAVQGANPCVTSNPCASANPCSPGGGGNAYGGLISLINHLAFGLVLAFMIRLSPARVSNV
jgi:hypothetical protein